MIIRDRSSIGAYGATCPTGSWENWCDCTFPAATDPTNNGKCRQWRPTAPWTIVGAMLRGIPHGSGLNLPGVLTPDTSAPPAAQSAPADDGLFGIPTTILLVGGGVLVAGIAASALLGKKRVKSR